MAALIPLQDCSQAPHQNPSKNPKISSEREERREEERKGKEERRGILHTQTLTPILIPTLH
jgi:hypothetical protein